MNERRSIFWVYASLVAAVFLVYAYAFQCEFIDFDDKSHVTENPCVLAGLGWASIQWAFTHFIAAQWIPLSWMSHMLDVSLFGVDPAWHHFGNVVLHAVNACLVFAVFRRLTGEFWPSAVVALLFAVHPINVESVAWIAERKNVLSTFFWLLAMWAYERHARQSGRRWMWVVTACMFLGLLAKGMPVTLPCAFLLLDVWPLRRNETVSWKRLLVEKIPLFVLSAIFSVATILAAKNFHSLTESASLPVVARLENALTGYVQYVSHIFWPENLAVFYKIETSHPAAELIRDGLILVAITLLAVSVRKRMPYVLMGWLWFLGVLVPVSSVFQVGLQASADRFTYVPQLGIFWAVVWAARELPARAARWMPAVAGATALILAGLTVRQMGFWHDTTTLFEYTLTVTRENGIAHSLAGMGRMRRGDYPQAAAHYRAAMQFMPWNGEIHARFGEALSHMGENTEAIAQFRMAIALEPRDQISRHNLVALLVSRGEVAEAAKLIPH